MIMRYSFLLVASIGVDPVQMVSSSSRVQTIVVDDLLDSLL